MTVAAPSPVAFKVHVRRLPKKGMPVRIEADAAQRAALAEAHGLVAVERFVADLTVRTWKADGVSVAGGVQAEIVQECVVTLDPVPARVDEEIEALFVPEGSRLAVGFRAAEGELHLSADGPDAPEVFAGDEIDVGALAEEFFGLGIDPYPRKAGIDAPAQPPEEGGDAEKTSPFAKLDILLRKT